MRTVTVITAIALLSACEGAVHGQCSSLEGDAAEIVFINRSDEHLELNWLDEQCAVHTLSTLARRSYAAMLSTVGHVWRLRAGNDVVYRGVTPAGTSEVIYPFGDTQACSSFSHEKVPIGIFNPSATERFDVWWVDPACAEVQVGTLEPQQRLLLDSFVGHRFSVRAAGTAAEVTRLEVTARPGGGRVSLSVTAGQAPACSDDGEGRAHVTFRNTSTRRVSVQWVSYACQELPAGDVEPGQTLDVDTFVTHVFRVRDPASQALLLESRITQPSSEVDVP